jgi:hypothetical protein
VQCRFREEKKLDHYHSLPILSRHYIAGLLAPGQKIFHGLSENYSSGNGKQVT